MKYKRAKTALIILVVLFAYISVLSMSELGLGGDAVIKDGNNEGKDSPVIDTGGKVDPGSDTGGKDNPGGDTGGKDDQSGNNGANDDKTDSNEGDDGSDSGSYTKDNGIGELSVSSYGNIETGNSASETLDTPILTLQDDKNKDICKQMDFGDAIDPNHPTFLKNNGAGHLIVPGIYLGNKVDAEADGQPELNSWGDDMSGVDDEAHISH